MGTLRLRALATSRVSRAMRVLRAAGAIGAGICLAIFAGTDPQAQTFTGPRDPGPRAVSVDAGRVYENLTTQQNAIFATAKQAFEEIGSVQGKIPNTGVGLGPRFNSVSCGSCHAQPAVGGSSPSARLIRTSARIRRSWPPTCRARPTASRTSFVPTVRCVKRVSRT